MCKKKQSCQGRRQHLKISFTMSLSWKIAQRLQYTLYKGMSRWYQMPSLDAALIDLFTWRGVRWYRLSWARIFSLGCVYNVRWLSRCMSDWLPDVPYRPNTLLILSYADNNIWNPFGEVAKVDSMYNANDKNVASKDNLTRASYLATNLLEVSHVIT